MASSSERVRTSSAGYPSGYLDAWYAYWSSGLLAVGTEVEKPACVHCLGRVRGNLSFSFQARVPTNDGCRIAIGVRRDAAACVPSNVHPMPLGRHCIHASRAYS